MEADHIKCPNCGVEIEVGAVLANKIAGDVEARIRAEAAKEREQAVKAAQVRERESVGLKLQKLEAELEAKSSEVKQAEQRELELAALQRDLTKKERALAQTVEQQVQEREKQLAAKIHAETADKVAREMESLQEAISSRDQAMDEARKRELSLINEKRELEQKRKGMELEYQYKLEEDRRKQEERYASEVDLKLKERDKQIDGLRTALADAKRKSEQGSMETQGEVLELDLEAKLQQSFPHDDIDPVPKGIRGADVIQLVRSHSTAKSGTIIWEAKNTKAWNSNWIEKLKDDQRELGANLAVIVSSVLPEGIRNFDLVDGVWVCSITSYVPLAMALRQQLLQVAFARTATEGKSEKMEMVYQYLSGDEFRQKVEAIVDTFVGMQEQLDREKRAYARIWKERDKQIQRIIENTAGMYGDIRGLIGSSVPEIQALTLDGVDGLLESDQD
ncbi:MAG: DUF2130 domain-containing protein [Gammaproteobacteria bacterium]|nr:DUF2130 domain-containing protein [Gammaproteobacteria bacterium]